MVVVEDGLELAAFVGGVPVGRRCSLRFGPVAWGWVKRLGAAGQPPDIDWDAYWAATDGRLMWLPARLDVSVPDEMVWVLDEWGRVAAEAEVSL